ncbi:ABC transporter substrate-binding protein [Roseomonas nepalensis]|uniref:ABC transporter substrate-binding protein n=1 Tax=Muricoccus nepalensis TaxID=1854500 RepID=A0A502FFK2_9PROT|nr:substrate-binding domain-containing protein [Roseomonas nepalensis]TPG48154.1 ABC transporter substrate-binding protein [Roseomonas nepalensis]
MARRSVWRSVRRGLILAALLPALAAGGRADEVRVLTAGAFKGVVVAAAPDWERETGHRLVVDNDTAGALARRVTAGESFDLLVVPPAQMAALARAGRVAEGAVPLARVGIGVAVRQGAPRPDIGTVEALRAAILAAPRLAYIDPASGGSSGTHVAWLLGRLGVAEAMRGRSVLVPGGLVAERLVDGSADFAIHQISEILPVAGAALVGPLPAEVQLYTTYAGALAPNAGEAARGFLARLSGEAGRAVLRARGMEPPG